jgi:hypothetical protein
MDLIVFVPLSKHLNILNQCLVTYLVPGVKGLPGGVDLVCHAGSDPPGYVLGVAGGGGVCFVRRVAGRQRAVS